MTDRIADACEFIVRWGLVALIVFTPLAFGTVETWSIAIMEWGIVTLVLVEIIGRLLRTQESPRRLAPHSGLALPLCSFLALALLQVVPIPATWLQKLSPGSAQAYAWAPPPSPEESSVSPERTQAMVDQLRLGPMPTRRPISINPAATRDRVLLLATFVALFFLVAAWADRRERILFLLTSVAIVGFLVAVFGLVQRLTWNGKIYWVRSVQSTSAIGPFVNHNHFAGYVEMIIPVALSLTLFLLDAHRRATVEESGDEEEGDLEGDNAEMLEVSEPFMDRWGQFGLAFFAAIVLLASLVLSLSRGGILSAILSALVLFVVLWPKIPSRIVGWSIAVSLPLMIVLFTLWVGRSFLTHGSAAVNTVWREASFSSRWIIWETMVDHLPLAGYTGFGLGAFEDSFARFTPPGTSARWDRAHNDYLQLAWETGLVGSLILAWCGLVFAYRYLWPALRGKAHPFDLFRAGVAMGILSIALHSWVDFNLQIGSNGFLCALLAGALVALHRLVELDQARQRGAELAKNRPEPGLHSAQPDRIV